MKVVIVILAFGIACYFAAGTVAVVLQRLGFPPLMIAVMFVAAGTAYLTVTLCNSRN